MVSRTVAVCDLHSFVCNIDGIDDEAVNDYVAVICELKAKAEIGAQIRLDGNRFFGPGGKLDALRPRSSARDVAYE